MYKSSCCFDIIILESMVLVSFHQPVECKGERLWYTACILSLRV